MGLNGSGKSTLLKLINGVMKPDAGEVLTRGRIAGLIATGAGFHPQLTGRDNVYLNAAILGMSEAETDRKFDAIVDFADIGKFLDTPVGHYSSGMFSRLGFAVAVNTDSDIFLIDEVLAVGDRPFKKKCMATMQEIRDEGRTMLYVSHAAGSVRKMCDRVLVLEKGVLGYDGPVDEGISTCTTTTGPRGRQLRGQPGQRRRGARRRRLRRRSHRRGPGDITGRSRFEIPPAGQGNYKFVVISEALASPCDCCDIWYSCESRTHRSTPRCPRTEADSCSCASRVWRSRWWPPSRPRRRTW